MFRGLITRSLLSSLPSLALSTVCWDAHITNAYAGCGRPTLNFIERFDVGRSVPTAKPLHLVCRMNIYLKMFCILCICDTSKASENLTFVLKQSLILSSDFVVIIICCLGVMKTKDSVEQMTLDLFQNCDVLEEVSVTFDTEIDLDDDAVGRSRYERFYSVRSN